MSPRRGDSLPTVWPRPAHTKAKHDILVKYLQAWFAIMGGSRYDQKVGVFDGFAGPGLYDDGEPGSPVLVVDALLATTTSLAGRIPSSSSCSTRWIPTVTPRWRRSSRG
jgi:three-Cys-motif partner protein